MENMKLSPPWNTYKHELDAMFGQDPEIRIVFDEEKMEIKLFVSDASKAEALTKILPAEKVFGNVKLKVTVVMPNLAEEEFILDTFKKAFRGNPALSYVYDAQSLLGDHAYVVFKDKIVQFFNDQLDDMNGNKTTLYQEIAKDIFAEDLGVFYCTEPIDRTLEKPLGEWP